MRVTNGEFGPGYRCADPGYACYDRRAIHFLARLYLASALIWMR